MLSIADDKKILVSHCLDNQSIIGTDEAGRGPLAGPLVVAGVLFPDNVVIPDVFDSKTLKEKKRESLALQIQEQALAYHIEILSLEDIEAMNIYQASKWGMISCFYAIQKKVNCKILLTDAMKINTKELPNVSVISLIKGDQKSFHIAAASILAKTTRDRIMKELHLEYPYYDWDKNKGYPTRSHREALKKYGISPYHRKGFKLL
ncbi:MAG: ribonuclease HII [Brevinema sp.]